MAQYISRIERKRQRLADVVPVDTPYVFGFFVGDVCNFKCKYCVQAATVESPDLRRQFMDWDTFVKVADQVSMFPKRIKKVLFSSLGEPLLNKNLPAMIAYLKQKNIADSYEIVTNASLLTHDLSKALIDAGLSRLCVSLQGITDEKYWEISHVKASFKKIVEELAFFYNYAKTVEKSGGDKCSSHIKTVDIALDDGEAERFKEIFSPICDTLFIDHIVPAFKGVDYSEMCDKDLSMYGAAVGRLVCPSVFYTLYALADGDVVTCCSPPYPVILGNVHRDSLVEMWNSTKRMGLLKMQLRGQRSTHPICAGCVSPMISNFEEDNLDEAAGEILARL